jgi:hypothetical protein
MPPDPSTAPPGAAIDVVFKLGGGRCRTCRQSLPGGLPSMSSSNSVVDAVGSISSTPSEPAIDVNFKLGGGRYRTRWKCPPRGLPSTSSSTSLVDAAEPAGSAPPGAPPSTSSSNSVMDAVGLADRAPQGAHHRCRLQTRWWTLPDPPTVPLGGAAIDVIFKLGGGCYWTRRQRPQGGRHRRHLQPQWWTLPDPPAAPPLGGLTSTSSSNSVVDAVAPFDSAP